MERRSFDARPVAWIVVVAAIAATLCGAAALASTGSSSGQATDSAAQESARSPIAFELWDGRRFEGQVDSLLVELRDRLRALGERPVPDRGSIDALFSIPLNRLDVIEERIGILDAELAQLGTERAAAEARLANLASAQVRPDEAPEGEAATGPGREEVQAVVDLVAKTRIREEIARQRREALRKLGESLRAAPAPALAALAQLDAPRTALRARAGEIEELSDALSRAAGRLETLAARIAAGGLVGFVIEARELEAALPSLAREIETRARSLAAEAVAFTSLAASIEDEGRALRTLFVASAATRRHAEEVDATFMERVEEQRALRRRTSAIRSEGEAASALVARAAALAVEPGRIGTTAEARAIANEAIALGHAVDLLLARSQGEHAQWRLAFVNESVALLATRSSREARSRAYALTWSLLSDVRNELELASERVRTLSSEGWRDVASFPEWVSTSRGRDVLVHSVATLAVVVVCLAIRRRSGKIVVAGVRAASHWGPLRVRIGLLVRSAGLLQRVLPVLALLPIFWAVVQLMGREGLPAELAAAVFHPFFLYVLGKETLVGATRQITRGRPALVTLSEAARSRLMLTYARLGLIFAVAACVDSLASVVIGPGRIVFMVETGVAVMLVVWGTWATLAWRVPLAQAWTALTSGAAEGRENALAAWMEHHPLGFLLTPVALARLVATHTVRLFAREVSETDAAKRVRAMFLRRRSRRSALAEEARSEGRALPPEVLAEFPLYPVLDDTEALLLPRDELVQEILDQLASWRETRGEGSLVLVGDKGSGKTTLGAMVSRRMPELKITRLTLRGTHLSEHDLVRALAPALGLANVTSVRELATALGNGEDRAVIVDEAQALFLRVIGGYRAFESLVSLVNETSAKVFWIVVFNRHTWRFLSATQSSTHFFRRVIELPPWTADEIQDLMRRRTAAANRGLVFSESLRTDALSGGELDLIDGSEAYFRLLFEASGGNPRIATRLWLDSLVPIDDDRLEVGLFNEAPPEVLARLDDDLVFALGAIAQRENLDPTELARTLNTSTDFALYATRFLREKGLVEAKESGSERVTLAPRSYHHVLRSLRNRHLLME